MSTTTIQKKRADVLHRTLLGQRELLGLTYDELASRVGLSKATTHKLMHSPEKMNLSQLRSFCRALQLAPDEIRGLLPLQ